MDSVRESIGVLQGGRAMRGDTGRRRILEIKERRVIKMEK